MVEIVIREIPVLGSKSRDITAVTLEIAILKLWISSKQ